MLKQLSVLWWGLVVVVVGPSYGETYRPLETKSEAKHESIELEVVDPSRKRNIPIRVCLPKVQNDAPVVLFSHGLGGGLDAASYLANHLTNREHPYVVVYLQHPGSDEAVWKDVRLGQRMAALREAASADNLALRCGDVSVVIDQLTKWNASADHPLHQRLKLEKIGMSGHSFGAYTTQAVCGQRFPFFGQKYLEPRIDAALALSPSTPRAGAKETAFGSVSIPWMLITGTKDGSPIGDQTPESRLEVFPYLPKTIDHYELVLDGATHAAFSDRLRAGELTGYQRSVLQVSTAFWDAYLHEDEAAKRWLASSEVAAALAPQDRWQISLRSSTN